MIPNNLKKKVIEKDYFLINLIFRFIRLSLTKRKSNVNKILILSFKNLGDTVFTIPAIKYLRRNLGNKEIVVFCFDENKSIYEIAFSDLSFVTFPKNKINLDSPFINLKVIKEIRKHSPGLIIDFTSGLFIALTLLFSRSKNNVGFNLQIFRNIYDTFSARRTKPHLNDMYLDPVKYYLKQEVELTDYQFPASMISEGSILIFPFAGWKAKEWGIKKYYELGEKLSLDYDIKFVMLPNAISNDIEDEFIKEKMDIIYTKDINELISEIKKSSLVISNDTGSIYIAALLGKPTFTIYGPTNPLYSLPYGSMHDYMQKKIKCSPEVDKQYCFKDAGRNCFCYDCMNSLSVTEVTKKVINFINKLSLSQKRNTVLYKNN